MNIESISGIPISVENSVAIMTSRAQELGSERQKAYNFLQETIFPLRIKKLSSQVNSGFGLASPYEIWEDISLESAVLDLYWNIQPEDFVEEDNQMHDIYSAWAISVEMLPTGVAILRGGSEISSSILMPNEWKNNKRLQTKSLNRVLSNPKEDIFYSAVVSRHPYFD